MQQAMAMSLSQELPGQENGVANTSNQQFGPANREHYDTSAWAMTLSKTTAHEIIINPDPEHRKRGSNEPAFLRPSEQTGHLPGLLTILHSIPLAREALLLGDATIHDYGHDNQWWNGTAINIPKIVSLEDYHQNSDWNDMLHEAQRLMAFLDLTDRAYGSSDVMANLNSVQETETRELVPNFLKAWQGAAVRAAPDSQLATIFASVALKRPLRNVEEPIHSEFACIDPYVESRHGQDLYDILDHIIWPDSPDTDLDDVWLDHVAEVFTIRLSSRSGNSLDVKIPPVWYPDRYLDQCKGITQEMRMRKLDALKEISRLQDLIDRYSKTRRPDGQVLDTRKVLESAARSAEVLVSNRLTNGVQESAEFSPPPQATVSSADAQKTAQELRRVVGNIDRKLKCMKADFPIF